MRHLLNVDLRGFICGFDDYFYLQVFSINDVVFTSQFYFLFRKNVQAKLSFFQRLYLRMWYSHWSSISIWFVTENSSDRYRELCLIKERSSRQCITFTIKQILQFLRRSIFYVIYLTYWNVRLLPFTRERLYLEWRSRYWETVEDLAISTYSARQNTSRWNV